MNILEEIDQKLSEYAEAIPGKGMHLNYLFNAREILNLYEEAHFIIENEGTTDANKAKLEEILNDIKDYVD